MAVERRKLVPKAEAIAIIDAARELDEATARFEEAIVAALRAGGSYREVAGLAGKAVRTVELLGRAHGWPDAKEQKRRQAEADAREEGRRQIEHYRQHGRLPDDI